MGKETSISWTDSTWNPWRGCLKVSPGCKACYMYRDQERYGKDPKAVVRAANQTFTAPMRWHGPSRVFTCSWSDFFIEEADMWRRAAWDIIRLTPHLTYQILTKRPENVAKRLPADWGDGWPNVWLGVSIESEDYLERIYHLAMTAPAVVHFVSYEPALGYVNFEPAMFMGIIDWMISGGESGFASGKYAARPADPEWFRSVRDACVKYGVPYFHKQNGGTVKVDGEWGGRELDGEIWEQFPQAKELT